MTKVAPAPKTPQPRPTGAELLARAEALRPQLLERQEEAEKLRRLPEATMREFHDAGILRVIQPAMFGGAEADFIDQIDMVFTIARACGSSGWVYAVLSAHAAMIANFPERAQHEVWDRDPAALASSSLFDMGSARRAEGGYVVSGHWRYSSGCDYCAWLVGGAVVEDEAKTRLRFLLPIAELEIIDDWRVMGLAGTGSKSLRGTELFVPEWRAITDAEFLDNSGPGREVHGHCHLYRMSRTAHPGPLSLAMAGVGIAQHAVDWANENLARMGVGRTSATEREAIRHDIAESAAEADAARLLIRRTVIAMEDAARARQPATRELRELAARDRHFATLYALRAAERLFKAAGSRALFDGNDLQRCFRDVHAVASRGTRLGAIGRMSGGEV
jgi:3-hydroxy-9,10-secoandrosta-1,3,5(10)-triene-9,17-dione monooxygenase